MFRENLKKSIKVKINNTKLCMEICKDNSFNSDYFLGYLHALESIYELIK